ncbi:hypothetical protein DOY81_007568 [Sarcophaga bullata]|nr:hypothetical protein DOY81_007568 [Sarcophaga bullata]
MQSYGDARFRSYGFDNDMEMETESESPNAAAAGVKSKSIIRNQNGAPVCKFYPLEVLMVLYALWENN